MTAIASYEKEFYFFNKFTVPSGCGEVTYALRDSSNVGVLSNIAVIDEIALVPDKFRIFIKDASSIATHTFSVVATNTFGVASANS